MLRASPEQRVRTLPDARASSRRDNLYLAAIILLGAFFRFSHLGTKPLWQDEAWSWQFTCLNWHDLFHFLAAHEINMSPYHLLLKAWIATFGDSEAALRTLSAIVAILTIPVVYAIGKRLFSPRDGLLAALLLSLNAFHVRYSQEARGYTLAVLLVALAVLLFLKALERSSLTCWVGQAVLLALATYIHMFAVLVAIALWTSLLLRGAAPLPAGQGAMRTIKSERAPFNPGVGLSGLTAAVALYAVLCLPLAYFARLQGSARLGWIQPMGWKTIAIFLKLFCGNSGFPLAIVTVICLISALIYSIRFYRKGQSEEGWPYTLLFLWLVIPIVATAIVSIRKPIFVPRYLLICLPALTLLISAALISWRSRVWKAVFLAALLVMSLRGIFAYHSRDFDVPRADWPAATHYIFNHAQPDDAIATRGANSAIEYYSRNFVYGTNGLPIFAQEGQSERPSAQALQAYPRVWCVLQNKNYGLSDYERQQNQQLTSACEQGRIVSSAQEFRGLRIALCERK